ncbi:MAG: SRPBCC family protein [Gammaproteobacteria bacterium]|nr:MAG: SRPBCC family protein [Gammaproteobacteria bacterium]
MTTISHSAIVPYTCAEMYDLVTNVNEYSDFLPWCGGSRIISSTPEKVVAELRISYKKINKAFTTENTLMPNERMVMNLIEGPFKHLRGEWVFIRLDDHACKVALELDFEFSSKLIAFALGPVFSNIANTFVDNFRQRAEQVYGKR